jgi:phosphatidylglycerol---prolipoprotein diacylglyceryl transferase
MSLDRSLHASYALLILLGVALLLLFRPTAEYADRDKRAYWRLQALTFVAALFGAKFAVLLGDALWPLRPVADWSALLWTGRSIVGALLFGFLAAEALKPLLKYPLPPNDRFAVILPFSIATGRLGCWFTGCCLGEPMHGGIALVAADGVSRYPAALVESAFHLLAGIALMLLWRRRMLSGRLFALYLLAYGAFRFGTEYLRVTEKAFAGFSAYQWLCLIMILAAAVALYLRRGGVAASPSQPVAEPL